MADVFYRNGTEYWPATPFNMLEDLAYAGHIHARALDGDALNLRVTLPDGRIADRVHVPHGDYDGGWVAKAPKAVDPEPETVVVPVEVPATAQEESNGGTETAAVA